MESVKALLSKHLPDLQLVQSYPGGQGMTICVQDSDGERLLLKVLPPGDEPTEASIAASVHHPSIPSVRMMRRLADGRTLLLREHVAGEVQTSLPPDPKSLRSVVQQLLEVIAFVHMRGVLHLDLKPGNLILDAAGQLHLLDFGLAVRSGAQARGGTPFFAAPEILFGASPDGRADLFSIGAMVVHALTQPDAQQLDQFVRRFPQEDFCAAAGVQLDQLPATFAAFVRGCVARRPGDRFPDADTALETLCGGGAGRPCLSTLVPDPVQLYARELRDAERATQQHDRSVCIVGGEASDRSALAMQLAVTVPNSVAIEERGEQTRVIRSQSGEVHMTLPPLDEAMLAPHLRKCFDIGEQAVTAAARWLLADGSTISAVTNRLRGLVDSGQLLAAGNRWVWPDARLGRLHASAATAIEASMGSRVDQIRAATARGLLHRARALWQGADEQTEPAARIALVEGLLDSGEPARALPLCADLPVLRAQCLVDTGQYALAAETLAAQQAPTESRHRRILAQLAMAEGDVDRAREFLKVEKPSLQDRLLLAALHQQSGALAASEDLLNGCLAELDEEQHGYACASLHTTYGHLERQRSNPEAARQHFEKADQIARRIAHMRHAATSQLNLGVLAKDLGDFGDAATRFREAKALYEHVGDVLRAAIAAANLGIAALARDDLATAQSVLEEAVATLLELGDVNTAQLALVMLARTYARRGEVDAAATTLARIQQPNTERVRRELGLVQDELAEAGLSGNDDGMPADRQEQPSRELFRTFLAVNRKLAQAAALEEAMNTLLEAAVTLTGGRNGFLLVLREDGVQREYSSGLGATHAQAFSRSLANQAVQEQRTLTGRDMLANPELQAMRSVKNLRVRSAVCAPFQSAGGTKGAIYVEHPGRADVFTPQDLEALEILADQAAIAVDRMLREEDLREQLSTQSRQLDVAKREVRGGRRSATPLLGESGPMAQLRAEIAKLADLDLSILIQGETGTGKELVARALHEQGERSKGPFVAENCSALPAELMERELFGHVEGAFTGATADRPGILELANGGTLFLDEVGDMPATLQAKLLRALQERTIRRVGGSESIDLDLRMVAATHRDLRAMVAGGAFREDLFYRLAAVELRVPPLRERHGDIELLAEHFLERTRRTSMPTQHLGDAAQAALTAYAWPGNVRELEHVIARAALLCDGDEIVDLQLPQPLDPAALDTPAAAPAPPPSASSEAEVLPLKAVEKQAIATALSTFKGDKTKAARALGISRTALYDKIKRHGLS